MGALEHVAVAAMDPRRFESVISAGEYAALLQLIDRSAQSLQGRVIWNVNSTASGGGVVELLRPLLGYARGGGVDARWAVVVGDAPFFAITKRLHNHLHGTEGDGGRLGAAERTFYERSLGASGRELADLVRRDDVVILHDPQTAGLVSAAHDTGATVIWRCHVGVDHVNSRAREAWDFLLPYLGGRTPTSSRARRSCGTVWRRGRSRSSSPRSTCSRLRMRPRPASSRWRSWARRA
jgi:trehalose synthase